MLSWSNAVSYGDVAVSTCLELLVAQECDRFTGLLGKKCEIYALGQTLLYGKGGGHTQLTWSCGPVH
jgi:hypothetical protein